MAELLGGLIILAILTVLGFVIYKYRHFIKRYIHDPKYGSSWHPERETTLRRKIEDATAEIEWLHETPEKSQDKE